MTADRPAHGFIRPVRGAALFHEHCELRSCPWSFLAKRVQPSGYRWSEMTTTGHVA